MSTKQKIKSPNLAIENQVHSKSYEREVVNDLVRMLKKIGELKRQEFARIESVIREAMAAKIQDLDYLDKLTVSLYDFTFSGFGLELYDVFLDYIASFNPQRAKEYRDRDDEI